MIRKVLGVAAGRWAVHGALLRADDQSRRDIRTLGTAGRIAEEPPRSAETPLRVCLHTRLLWIRLRTIRLVLCDRTVGRDRVAERGRGHGHVVHRPGSGVIPEDVVSVQ